MSNEKTDENHVWFSSVFSKLIHMMNLAIFIVYQTYELLMSFRMHNEHLESS